jgi:hypothetical protein
MIAERHSHRSGFSVNARNIAMTMVAGSEIYGAGGPMNAKEAEIKEALKDIRRKLRQSHSITGER